MNQLEEQVARRRTQSGFRRAVGFTAKSGAVIIAVLAIVLTIAHFRWKYSGSNTWETEINRDGITVYTRKSPGSVLKDYLLVTRMKASMKQVAAAMMDTSLRHCSDWNGACVEARTISPWNDKRQSITYYRLNLPFPFRPRDLVFQETISQDPKTKMLTAELQTVEGYVPESSCCVRVPLIHNVWRWTPLGNNEIEVQVTGHSNHGLPYWLTNLRGGQLFSLMKRVPRLVSLDEYRNAKLDFIQEPTN